MRAYMVESGSGKATMGDQVEARYQYYHDMQSEESLSTTIVSALLEIEDVEVPNLGFTLQDYVDTDALDSLFVPKMDGTPRKETRIEFTVPGYEITIESEGDITITDLDSWPSAAGMTGMRQDRQESLQD